jgi:hypothetical protein
VTPPKMLILFGRFERSKLVPVVEVLKGLVMRKIWEIYGKIWEKYGEIMG